MQIQISWLLQIWIYTVCKGRVYPGSARQGLIKSSYLRRSYNKVSYKEVPMYFSCGAISLMEETFPISLYYNETNETDSVSIENGNVKLQLFCFYSYILTLILLNPNIPCLCKQCRSRSVGFWRSQLIRSQLIWICTVCHLVYEFISTISNK